MDPNTPQAMQHELQVRAQVIRDLQRDMERMRTMIEKAAASCQRLREENILINAQAKGLMKACLLDMGRDSLFISRKTLEDARRYKIDSVHKQDGAPGIRLVMAPLSKEEMAQEESMRQQLDEVTEKSTRRN